jgi:hypothetical protein
MSFPTVSRGLACIIVIHQSLPTLSYFTQVAKLYRNRRCDLTNHSSPEDLDILTSLGARYSRVKI